MLQVEHISKKFQSLQAVQDVSLHLKPGEFYGLLGPNGAGKTTTIHIISAIMPPDTGTVFIAGKDVYKNITDVKMRMGIVPQEIALYDDMNALENLLFWGSLYNMKGNAAKEKALALLAWVGLADRKKDLVKTYSGGMKRRINIACALMHDPALILMDEPTVGIDPQSRNKIYEILEDLHSNKKTILYTTHYMEEAERLCDTIGIIDRGKIIAEGSLQELRSKSKTQESIVIHYEGSAPAALNGFTIQVHDDKKEMMVYSQQVKQDLPTIVKLCYEAGVTIQNMEVHYANLETIFLTLTGRQLRE
jgi:ABC-2 type transport system ATP-binding protein